jgi:Arylsulfotransferase (ASST)
MAAILPLAACAHAEITGTDASVRPENSLIADIRITASGNATRVFASYQTAGAAALVTPVAPLSVAGRGTLTIGRLRANSVYTYTVTAVDDAGNPAGMATGGFTTGPLPAALTAIEFELTGRFSVPVVILPLLVAPAGPVSTAGASFRGYIALDLRDSDAPQIVWYYSNAPSTASGTLQADAVGSIVREANGNLLLADAGSGPPPLAADAFYREIAPDGSLLAESPAGCTITPPPAGGAAASGWIWGQGNDVPEQLPPGADGVPGTVLHLGKVVKDPFGDAGLAPRATRLQIGATIRRWNLFSGADEVVWDPFAFLDPLTERTDGATSDPAANSNSRVPMPCAGVSIQAEDWMHANSLDVTPWGTILMSIRHLDTVIAIAPEWNRIEWRIGGVKSDFAFRDPADRFYHQHFVRMLENGNVLLMDNGNGRAASEGGQYSRALELALDWQSMTAVKAWEYRHLSGDGVYKYADKVGSAERLQNGNTLVLFGADVDPATLAVKDPQTFTLVEAGAESDSKPVAVLDMKIPGNSPVYRALPVETLFGETTPPAARGSDRSTPLAAPGSRPH